jgi:hypothetical protein
MRPEFAMAGEIKRRNTQSQQLVRITPRPVIIGCGAVSAATGPSGSNTPIGAKGCDEHSQGTAILSLPQINLLFATRKEFLSLVPCIVTSTLVARPRAATLLPTSTFPDAVVYAHLKTLP